jgi:DNA-nicking Smr family endonuclease
MIKSTLSAFLTNDELNRLRENESESGELQLTVDVHGLHCNETKKYLNNMINASRKSFLLVVIHGYNHGTAIKEMLAYDFSNSHVVRKYSDSCNYGVTYMQIAA